MRVPQFGNIAVSGGYPFPHLVGAWNLRDQEELETDDDVASYRANEIEELPLGRLACRIGHIVHEPDG
jgi:hypothetical protein